MWAHLLSAYMFTFWAFYCLWKVGRQHCQHRHFALCRTTRMLLHWLLALLQIRHSSTGVDLTFPLIG